MPVADRTTRTGISDDMSFVGSGAVRPERDLAGRLSARGAAQILNDLEPHSVGAERAARGPRPSDRSLALLDPLLARPTLVVEGDDIESAAGVAEPERQNVA
jgi:hypothetical protein